MDIIDAILDPDYFLKAIEECLKNRFQLTEGAKQQKMLQEQDEREKMANKIKEELHHLKNCDKVEYLQKTVYPALYAGFMMLDKERPEDPLSALALFLLENKNLTKSPVDLIHQGNTEQGISFEDLMKWQQGLEAEKKTEKENLDSENPINSELGKNENSLKESVKQ